MANIHVRRGSQFSGGVRSLKIFVDGREAGSVKRKETTTLAVPAGDHEVHIKMDWVRSPAVQVTADDRADVRLLAILPETRLQAFKSLLRPSRGLILKPE